MLAVIAGGGAWLLDASIDPAEEVHAPSSTDKRQDLARVKSWAYQLQRLDVQSAAASPADLVVVDEMIDGFTRPETAAKALNRLKRKPDGGRRLVLAYLSIGEAETYRPYWKAEWTAASSVLADAVPANGSLTGIASLGGSPAQAQPMAGLPPHARFAAPRVSPLRGPHAGAPTWLGSENAEWRGNFRVRFWDADWQRLMYGNPRAALERIAAAGFDGVYLDRADVYSLWQGERPTAQQDMIEFIERLSAHARRLQPGFLVVMQNAEELLASARVRATLDGVAKEDLLYGVEGEGRENTSADITSSINYLKLARSDGLPVLVIEYLADTARVTAARSRIEREGFVPYFGPRGLNALGRAG